jgi:hypothetical protein
MPKSAETGGNREVMTIRPQAWQCRVPLVESRQGLILGYYRRADFSPVA